MPNGDIPTEVVAMQIASTVNDRVKALEKRIDALEMSLNEYWEAHQMEHTGLWQTIARLEKEIKEWKTKT